jgi:hypothetical protein
VSPLPQHLVPVAPCSLLLLQSAARPFVFVHRPPRLRSPPPTAMAPTQPIQVLDTLPWHRSTVTGFALNELVNGGQLAPNVDGQPPAWIVPPAADREPNPPFSNVVSFVRHHEHGFAAPASRFMRGLCYHYGVELHNFAPNAISQAATFVVVCEGFLGIPVNWDLWVHLFRAELHTLTTPEPRVRRVVHAGGLSISLWESRREPDLPPTSARC